MNHSNDSNRIYMELYDPASNQDYITAFGEPDCEGHTGAFHAGPSFREKKNYNPDGLDRNHISEDDIQSVMIPEGYQVRFFGESSW